MNYIDIKRILLCEMSSCVSILSQAHTPQQARLCVYAETLVSAQKAISIFHVAFCQGQMTA